MNEVNTMTKKEAALHYAGIGWRLVPCRPGSKVPLITDWPEKATSDLEQVEEWWLKYPSANIARMCDEPVLDFDSKRGRSISDLLSILTEATGIDLKELGGVYHVTPTGGRHYPFELNSAEPPRRAKSNILDDIEVKYVGGLAMLPPSDIADNPIPYFWEQRGTVTHLPYFPQEFVDAIARYDVRVKEATRQIQVDGKETEIHIGTGKAVKLPIPEYGIVEGGRDDTLISYAGTMRGMGWEVDEIHEALDKINDDHCDPPLPDRQVAKIAKSAGRWEKGPSVDSFEIKRTKKTDTLETDEQPPRPSVISAIELMDREIPEPEWIVPRLLPAGLHIQGGKSKIGKTLNSLTLAKAITAGGEYLGQSVNQGRVLYLCLDDPDWRMKKRLEMQGWTRENLGNMDLIFYGSFWEEYGDLAKQGSEKLLEILQGGDYVMAVIDTLGRATMLERNAYEATTFGLARIQAIARELMICVFMNDHHNKMKPEEVDALLDIGGSVAKGAMLDSAWGIYRDSSGNTRLHVVGKDLESAVIKIELDPTTLLWRGLGQVGDIRLTDRRQEILLALKDNPKGLIMSQIVEAVGQDFSNTSKRVADLVAAGKIAPSDVGSTTLYHVVPDITWRYVSSKSASKEV